MGKRCALILRKHLHALLFVPVIVIIMTWPTFSRIFDADEFWLHGGQRDRWLDIWNAWHVERVLAGQAEYYFTDTIFHPQGLSLAFQHIALPHALLLIVFNKFMPVDDAYNTLYLLMLCFNALCGYVLTQHLVGDKWIALFGAAVVGLSPHFLQGTTVPDIILIGTFPLAVYCFHRSLMEDRWLFAALAGICVGFTTFIGMYTYVITLLTLGICGFYLSLSRWRQVAFWRHLLLFLAVAGLISAFRVFPMVADTSVLDEGLQGHQHDLPRSHDVLHYFVPTRNPFTEDSLRALFQAPPAERHSNAYLGYINLFLLACAILWRPGWRKLLPWLTALAFFAILRLGHYFQFRGNEYTNIVLPERLLSDWFPAVFGAFHAQEYYQTGLIIPLAVLSCFGLAAILKAKPATARIAVVLLSTLILMAEYYVPRGGRALDANRTAYMDWLQSEADDPIKLINLPLEVGNPHFFMYLQTLTGYPHADGFSSRNPQSARKYINDNFLLRHLGNSQNVHCLPHNERTFLNALDRLLEDGFTHVVVHYWLYGEQFIIHSFNNVPAAYDDHFVGFYRLRDLRLSCDYRNIELSPYKHFAESSSVFPGRRSSILSFRPSARIDEDLFAYFASLFSDWRSLVHLYLDDGKPVIQSVGQSIPDLESFARDKQLIYLIYNRHDMEATTLPSHLTLEGFNLCRRDEHEDGSVIEHYLSREFACTLIASGQPLQVDYDNGAKLVNVSLEITQDQLALQILWSNLPSEPHSVSLQVFDAAGAKVLGQDTTIGSISLERYLVDVSDLEPGDYEVKLVFYDYESKRSVPGTVSLTGERFMRELLITTLTRT